MKFGYTSIGFNGYDMIASTRFLRDIGYNGIEVIYYPEAFSKHIPDFEKFCSHCRQIGINLASFRFITETNAKSVENSISLIKNAKNLGFELCDCKVESPTPENATENDYKNVINTLKTLGTEAKNNGMKLMVETHPGVLHDNAKGIADILSKVAMPDTVMVNYDQPNMSYAGKESTDEALAILKDIIGFVHLKNGWFRNPFPVWTDMEHGFVDNLKIIKTLNQNGYKGWYMVEAPSGGDPFARAESDYKYFIKCLDLIKKYNL